MSTIQELGFSHYALALSGGLLIGVSTSIYLLLLGRIAGVAGLIASAVGLTKAGSAPLARTFVAALVAGGAIASQLRGPETLKVSTSIPLLIVAGVLVGFGSRLGSGCTSGHGICGIARISRRSICATGIFMMTGAAVVFFTRHVLMISP